METSDLMLDEHCIGVFGDKRLCKVGIEFYSRVIQRNTVCVRRLSDDRATQTKFQRFLDNPRVTSGEIDRYASERTARAVAGRHVLAIQDTSELDYSVHAGRTTDLGKISNPKRLGLFIHPVLVVDADNHSCLGIAHEAAWVRDESLRPRNPHRPIEEKETKHWLDGAEAARRRLQSAEMVTVVADRESDIYDEWDRIPDARTHLLTRAYHDRQLDGGGTLFGWVDAQPIAACFSLEVPARAAGKPYRTTNGGRTKARTAHTAHMDLRYGQVRIKRPQGSKARQASIELSVVDVRESAETVPPGEEPLHWILLTTHAVDSVDMALRVVGWYQQRWQIEQLFRTLKRQGLEIESSQLERADELIKLAYLATLAAARTLQLVNARDGPTDQPASDAFDDEELVVMEKLQGEFEGKTEKQKNPYAPHSMAWAAWTIARMGGWKGYASEAKPGPITMLHGLQRFDGTMTGWKLAKMCA